MNRKLELDEIHSITLDLMDRFHSICEENDIKYYLIFGTLIGAVRHRGFIPWDDDFDVCMVRDDYNKFCEILFRQDDERYKLANRANTPNYYFGISRYYDSRFEYRAEVDIKQFELGIFIDIYPLDLLGEKTDAIHRRVQKINRDYIIYCNRKSCRNKMRNLVRIPYHYYLHLKYGRQFPQLVDKMVEDTIYADTEQNTDYVGIYWETKDFRVFDKALFKERELCQFEDRMYWIPKGYDEILRIQYGDYMRLPPECERVAKHNYSIYDKES